MNLTHLENLLEELSKSHLISTLPPQLLKVNQQKTCTLRLLNGIKIQLELDQNEKNLLIGCVLGNLGPGKYRNTLFITALKANGMPFPRYGTFAFSKKTNDLILFDLLEMKDITGLKVSEYLASFIEKANIWYDAIKSSNIPLVDTSSDHGLFSLTKKPL